MGSTPPEKLDREPGATTAVDNGARGLRLLRRSRRCAKTAIWISGASSGIGAALATSVPFPSRLIGISRRPPAAGEHLEADLADPAGWSAVRCSFERTLATDVTRALFLHFAGVASPCCPADLADPAEYQHAVLLNSASGQVLGQTFLATCGRFGVQPIVVLCSSPAALVPVPGMSHDCAAKLAHDRWAEVVRIETAERSDAVVFTVVPFAVDTPTRRETMAKLPEPGPPDREAWATGAANSLAAPAAVAREIWTAVERGAGAPVFVGAVPPDQQKRSL